MKNRISSHISLGQQYEICEMNFPLQFALGQSTRLLEN